MCAAVSRHHFNPVLHTLTDVLDSPQHLHFILGVEAVARLDFDCRGTQPYDLVQVMLQVVLQLLQCSLADALHRKPNAEALVVNINVIFAV